jgi:hypothetical protein
MYRHGLCVSEAINFRSERFDLNSVARVGSAIDNRQRRWLRKSTQYGVGRYPDRSAYLNELNDFEASLASLIFGDKRLMSM